jgi:hypothetical protein
MAVADAEKQTKSAHWRAAVGDLVLQVAHLFPPPASRKTGDVRAQITGRSFI